MHFGTMYINWATRKMDVAGMDGCGNPEMTAEDVIKFLEEPCGPDEERWGLIWWDDVHQLCMHDLAGFSAEVDDKDEDDEK